MCQDQAASLQRADLRMHSGMLQRALCLYQSVHEEENMIYTHSDSLYYNSRFLPETNTLPPQCLGNLFIRLTGKLWKVHHQNIINTTCPCGVWSD
jgi:hypothetical protein